MPQTPSLDLSGHRFRAVYAITGDAAEAERRATDICLEQTVEFPADLIPREDIARHIVGELVAVKSVNETRCEATIDFAIETAGGELTQLLNVLFGNISIKPGIRLLEFTIPDELGRMYRGPRFGQQGLRELIGVHDRPLLCTAIKPMGLSAEELALATYKFALGGIDLIKDDHGLADQGFCPFDQRVKLCSDAVQRANAETGQRCTYLPNVTAPADQIVRRALRAREAGAGGLLFCPGLAGMDAMRVMADLDELSLPILSHPAFLGPYTMSPTAGISHGAFYGQISRLAGADGVIFPNYGGRFSFTPDECRDIVHGCTRKMAEWKSIFPVPAGGMNLGRVPELCEFYGRDSILLVGGDLHRHGPDLVQNCRKFKEIVETAFTDKSE